MMNQKTLNTLKAVTAECKAHGDRHTACILATLTGCSHYANASGDMGPLDVLAATAVKVAEAVRDKIEAMR